MSDDVDEQGRLFVVTGIQGSGKTTVGRGLAEALPKAVFIDGDTVGNMVISGKQNMTAEPTVPQLEQLLLRYAGALTLADVYRTAGFDAVIADNIFGRYLGDFLELADPEPIHLIVLHPSVEAVATRDAERGGTAYRDGFTVDGLWNVMENDTERLGLWLDTTNHTPAKTVVRILRDVDEALIEAE